MANGIVTLKGRSKMVKARAGDISLPPITEIAFGNGGTDENGTVLQPSTMTTSLNNEILRVPVDGHELISDTTCRYSYRIKRNELGGETINELGLFDSEGDLVIVKNFGNKVKDEDQEMIFEIDDEF